MVSALNSARIASGSRIVESLVVTPPTVTQSTNFAMCHLPVIPEALGACSVLLQAHNSTNSERAVIRLIFDCLIYVNDSRHRGLVRARLCVVLL